MFFRPPCLGSHSQESHPRNLCYHVMSAIYRQYPARRRGVQDGHFIGVRAAVGVADHLRSRGRRVCRCRDRCFAVLQFGGTPKLCLQTVSVQFIRSLEKHWFRSSSSTVRLLDQMLMWTIRTFRFSKDVRKFLPVSLETGLVTR